ncbi:MAG: hypothetical protein AAGB04_27815 [Pseudomonadota bacterium]
MIDDLIIDFDQFGFACLSQCQNDFIVFLQREEACPSRSWQIFNHSNATSCAKPTCSEANDNTFFITSVWLSRQDISELVTGVTAEELIQALFGNIEADEMAFRAFNEPQSQTSLSPCWVCGAPSEENDNG